MIGNPNTGKSTLFSALVGIHQRVGNYPGVTVEKRVGACEIHLATDFQNMVYEHPQFPAELKAEMYAWLQEHAKEERKPKDTEEQFLYKARKKAIGPFKKQLWGMEPARREAIGASLEERFTRLMTLLKINGTAAAVKQFVTVPQVPLKLDSEIKAAAGIITADEIKEVLQFGGTNAVVLEMHRQAVDVLHWMDAPTFANLFALAQLAPGPNVMIVSLIGWQVAGLAGLLVATQREFAGLLEARAKQLEGAA